LQRNPPYESIRAGSALKGPHRKMASEEQAGFGETADDDPRDQIARLEARIEELTEVIESCRKLILFAKAAIVGGAMWLLAVVPGLITFNPIALIGATAAIIGGIVVFGSNTSTASQAAADIKAAEARRAELIGKMNLRPIGQASGAITER
jgi:hypothetical protein